MSEQDQDRADVSVYMARDVVRDRNAAANRAARLASAAQAAAEISPEERARQVAERTQYDTAWHAGRALLRQIAAGEMIVIPRGDLPDRDEMIASISDIIAPVLGIMYGHESVAATIDRPMIRAGAKVAMAKVIDPAIAAERRRIVGQLLRRQTLLGVEKSTGFAPAVTRRILVAALWAAGIHEEETDEDEG